MPESTPLDVTSFAPGAAPRSTHWTYLPLSAPPASRLLVLTAYTQDPGGPCTAVLCEEHLRPALDPYLQQLENWRRDPYAHAQPHIPVTVDEVGLHWFSPEGAQNDPPLSHETHPALVAGSRQPV